MWPVEFEKRSCRPVEFKGQIPHYFAHVRVSFLLLFSTITHSTIGIAILNGQLK